MVWRDDDFPHTLRVHPDEPNPPPRPSHPVPRQKWTFFSLVLLTCEHSEHVDAHVVPFSHHLSPGKPEAAPLPVFLSSVCLRFAVCGLLVDRGELLAEERLHVRPDLVGFCPGECMQHTFTPGGGDRRQFFTMWDADVHREYEKMCWRAEKIIELC